VIDGGRIDLAASEFLLRDKMLITCIILGIVNRADALINQLIQ
jgi:hypothetical protein